MNKAVVLMAGCVVLSVSVLAQAAVIGDRNWADRVADYSANIQNYGAVMMSSDTEFWVTGPSDADANGNGYALDAGDPDYVAGWRSNAPGEYIVVQWDTGIVDGAGDDLIVRQYGGPKSSAKVFGSVDGATFQQIGVIGAGSAGYLSDVTFDLSGLFSEAIHYVKVERVGNGSQSGLFFDSFAGTVVPEPVTLALLGCGAAVLLRRRGGK